MSDLDRIKIAHTEKGATKMCPKKISSYVLLILTLTTCVFVLLRSTSCLAYKSKRSVVTQPGRRVGDRFYSKGISKERLSISLAEAVFLGLRKNNSIQSAYIDRVAQKFDLLVAEDVFSPHLSVAGSVLHETSGGIDTDSVEVAPQLTQLTPIGTQFSFVWDNTASRSVGNTNVNSELSFRLNQPLLRGAGLDVNLAPVKSARLNEKINQLNLRVTISQTVANIINAYRALILSREMKRLAEQSVIRAQTLIDIDQALIQSGRMARVEIVQAQADLESQKLAVLQSQSQYETARLALATLLNIDLTTELVTRELLDPKPVRISTENALSIAFKSRPDYLIQQYVVEQAKLGIIVAENQRLWDLSLVGGASGGAFYQAGGTSRSSTLAKLSTASVGLQLSAPLNDLTRDQNAIHASTSALDGEIQLAIVKQAAEQQIRMAVSDIDLKWRQVESTRRVASLSGSAVDVEKQKLNAGRSSNFQVQSLEANYRNALTQSLNATIDYLNALTLFDLQMGTTLETWKISLQD